MSVTSHKPTGNEGLSYRIRGSQHEATTHLYVVPNAKKEENYISALSGAFGIH
jgi:hypothetical protein